MNLKLQVAIATSVAAYDSPCILRPFSQPEAYGLKLKAVFHWRDIYIQNIVAASLVAALKNRRS